MAKSMPPTMSVILFASLNASSKLTVDVLVNLRLQVRGTRGHSGLLPTRVRASQSLPRRHEHAGDIHYWRQAARCSGGAATLRARSFVRVSVVRVCIFAPALEHLQC